MEGKGEDALTHRLSASPSKPSLATSRCESSKTCPRVDAQSQFSVVPDEILSKILSHLELKDLEVCKLVCKRWNALHYAAIRKLRIRFGSDAATIGQRWRVVDIPHALHSFPNLNSISICNLNGNPLDQALKSIANSCKELNELSFEHCRPVESDGVRCVLLSNPNIQTLTFKSHRTLNFSIESLHLALLPNLRHLEFEGIIHEDFTLTKQQMENICTLKLHSMATDGVFNYFSRLFPSQKESALCNLRSLSLNALPGDLIWIGTHLGSIPCLEALCLDFSLLPTELETFDLGPFPNLTRFEIRGLTRVKDYGPGLSKMEKLESLSLFIESHVDWLPVLTRLTELRVLSLEIKSQDEDEHFIKRKLQVIEELIRLRTLSLKLDWTSLSEFISLKKLIDLQSLTVDANGLDEFIMEGISDLKALVSLQVHLSNVNFFSIDLNLNEMTRLESLKTSGFDLDFHALDEMAWNYTLHLKSLTFECGQCTDFPCMWNLTSLESLTLTGSRIKTFPSLMSSLRNLRHLELHNFIELVSLAFPASCALLNSLIIVSAPKLRSLDDGILKLKFLHSVTLRHCPCLKRMAERFKALHA